MLGIMGFPFGSSLLIFRCLDAVSFREGSHDLLELTCRDYLNPPEEPPPESFLEGWVRVEGFGMPWKSKATRIFGMEKLR